MISISCKLDSRATHKSELGHFLSSIDWSAVDETLNCEAKLALFTDHIRIGLDHIMLVKPIRIHTNDAPWITEHFMNLIKLHQLAFLQEDKNRYRHYRYGKSTLSADHSVGSKFVSKKSNLKNIKASQWWGALKWITGMRPASASECLLSNLHIKGHFDHSSNLQARPQVSSKECCLSSVLSCPTHTV